MSSHFLLGTRGTCFSTSCRDVRMLPQVHFRRSRSPLDSKETRESPTEQLMHFTWVTLEGTCRCSHNHPSRVQLTTTTCLKPGLSYSRGMAWMEPSLAWASTSQSCLCGPSHKADTCLCSSQQTSVTILFHVCSPWPPKIKASNQIFVTLNHGNS